MAEQNKTVVIAVVAVLGLAVIGLGAWYFMSDSRPQPVVIDEPVPQASAEPAEPEPAVKEKRGPRKTAGDEQESVEIGRTVKHKPIEEMTAEEIKERRGDTSRPRGIMP